MIRCFYLMRWRWTRKSQVVNFQSSSPHSSPGDRSRRIGSLLSAAPLQTDGRIKPSSQEVWLNKPSRRASAGIFQASKIIPNTKKKYINIHICDVTRRNPWQQQEQQQQRPEKPNNKTQQQQQRRQHFFIPAWSHTRTHARTGAHTHAVFFPRCPAASSASAAAAEKQKKRGLYYI